uniref:Calmodulin n=1 Tax=Aplanochytrium stocchinoi TaxID=215587 RepID=A0A7S3PPL8_9STRA|mmetsp:Transcript_932/g.1202  ORF Transcript_932/g.1202 Transcript_932/m.1202 type:complete len:792 (+) Transcript_932:181-2556(+)|eukprot:CAMPEP_0204876016 /NCGR_PEP_ID=MMETSP1348-20121228/47401_1 /ASSEMBLY_ACC=CAM_ASM_000700 /TAXON_ID=215587 /ORGANISM="Aplanochytrium stocchinoi, Strain GSBS06" /LENGTH=791 /DNA_ID=CAMNT_0052032725 /DNA_START=68 /DNA_END=2443 /DNA_ORIENTATION=-
MDLSEALTNTASAEQVEVFGEVYREIVTDERGLTKRELCKEAFGLEDGYFADRIFAIFDADHSNRVNRDEFILGMCALVSKDEETFVEFLFDLFDSNDTGEIDEDELYQGMLASLRANKLSIAHRIEDFFDGEGSATHKADDEVRARELAQEIFAYTGHETSGGITKDEFKNVFFSYIEEWGRLASPLTKTRITTRKFKQYLSQNGATTENTNVTGKKKKKSLIKRIGKRITHNPQRTFWLFLWVIINSGLFFGNYFYYKIGRPELFELLGTCICLARGSALALQLNIAIALLTMSRGFLTFIRNAYNGEALNYINLDDNVLAHKMVGITILLLAIIHTAAHICDFSVIGNASADQVNSALGTNYTAGTKPSVADLWLRSWQGITGLLMLTCFAIAYPGILDWMRKRGHFHIFWGTHQMLIVFSIVVMIHGSQALLGPYTAVYWILPPFVIYLMNPLQRLILFSKENPVRVVKRSFLEPNVLGLELERNGLDYKAGQYVFLNVPEISLFEWHPFTLTSAPDDANLTVHIRNVGNWTKAVHDLYLHSDSDLGTKYENSVITATDPEAQADDHYIPKERKIVKKLNYLPRIYIDGPCGAPSQAYERYKVNVFIAAGIGVTPYASILSHILNRVRYHRKTQAAPEFDSMLSSDNELGLPIKKVYLFWATKDEMSIAWFEKLLKDLGELDVSEMIEIHHYYTSAHEKGDLRNALIGMAHGIQGQKMQMNRNRYYSHYGRPNWASVFSGIKKSCRMIDSKCGIFATVPPQFRTMVKEEAGKASEHDFRFHFTSENF